MIRPRLTSSVLSPSKRYFTQKTFDVESHVTAHASKPNTFLGHVSNKWSVGDAPNGGFLMTMAINAAKKVVPHPDPLTVTAYFVNKAVQHADVEMNVRVIAQTKGSSTVHVTMVQDEVVRSEYIGVFGSLDRQKGLTYCKKEPLNLPPIRDCFSASPLIRKVYGQHLKLTFQIEMHLPKNDPFVTGLFQKKQGKDATLNSWIAFEDHRTPCLSSLAFFLDAQPPPIINLTPSNWVPTLEYTVHFWDKPIHDTHNHHHVGEEDPVPKHWLQSKTETVFTKNGMLYTDGEIWSHDGKRLLATSRQFAKVLEPR
jgi:acyl-CoA thioesterase